MTAVLDSWAILAVLQNEPSAGHVSEVMASGETRMSSINLGEVHYKLVRTFGRRVARDRTDHLQRAVLVERADWELVRAAAEIKADWRLSYADAFCVATAQRHGAPLLTGDPEIVDAGLDVEVVDLRAPDV